MAGKKDFSLMDTERANTGETIATGSLYSSIEQSGSRKGQQGKASPEEIAARQSALKTQGRKGCKAIRINMAFSPENREYLRIMGRVTGKSMTEFCNWIIDQYRAEHPELYADALSLIERVAATGEAETDE